MAINMFNVFKKKDKNPPIKHKLWGKLEQEAESNWRVVTARDNYGFDGNKQYYDVEWWCIDEYISISEFRHLPLEKAKKILYQKREEEFYKLCKEVLRNRINSKLNKL